MTAVDQVANPALDQADKDNQIKERDPADEGILAAMYGSLDDLKALVKSGWSVNTQNADGKTALAVSCYQGWYEGASFLLASNADQMIADHKYRLPMHAATYDPKIRCLALLVQHMQPTHLNASDCELMTVLHWAAYHDRPDHVQLLISKSVNMRATDCDGKTALHWAAHRGNVRCIDILLREARGTDLVNIKDNFGKGAIHYAAAAGHCQTIECLSKATICNIHLGDPQDRQPLHWAAAMDQATCVELLLKLGADPNMHDVNTKNALYYAKAASNHECVTVLMAAMKILHTAKREKLKTLDAISNKRKGVLPEGNRQHMRSVVKAERNPREDNPAEELRIDYSSQINSSSTSISKVESNNAKQKLPPIRGSITKNKVQTIDDIDETLPTKPKTPPSKAIIAKFRTATLPKTEETAKAPPAIEEKPVNTAMTFVPTTRLYPQAE